MSGILKKHKDIWENKKIIREVYIGWFKKIIKDLKEGKTIELGSGTGNFKDFKPDVITSDIEKRKWLDMCFDAHVMPFDNQSIDNIVMIDVLHHLSNPMVFFREASRVLKRSGRIVLVEPYPTPFSLVIYRKYHPEPFIMNVNYFKKKYIDKKDPWDANQAIAYLLFFKNRKRFLEEVNNVFRIKKIHLMSCILYPASGGFENKALVPNLLIPFLKISEKILIPLRRILAFRCYIVLEKK